MRAAGYVRVSTARQAEEGLSLEQQQARVEDYIASQKDDGGSPWVQVYPMFVEAGVSGRRDDRPELTRLLAIVDQIDVLVIPKLDRLGRSTRHLLDVVEKLQASKVQLVSLSDHIDTGTSTGRLMLRMLASLAEFESDMISERVASVSNARAAKGRHHGTAPYGYEADEGLHVIEEQAVVVVRIYREYVDEGLSQRHIAKRLNDEGVTTPTGTGRWGQSTISRMLANSVYAGLVEVNGKTYNGVHIPIIDREMHAKAQQLRRATTRTRRGKSPRGKHLVGGGLLTCPSCGSVMRAVFRPRAKGRMWQAYECSKRINEGVEACRVGPVQREPIDKAIREYVTDAVFDLDATVAALVHAADEHLEEVRALRRAAERDAIETRRGIDKVKRDYTRGALPASEYGELSIELASELQAITANIQRLIDREAEICDQREQVSTQLAATAQLAAIKEALLVDIEAASDESMDALRAALRRVFVCFETYFVGSMPPGPSKPDDAVLLPEDLRAGNLVLLPRIRPEAIDWAAAQFPAIHRVPLPGQSEHAAKLALLYDLERVAGMLRDGNDPFYPDRDRPAFRSFLEALC